MFTLAAVAALVWALVLRPVEAPPKTYTAPDHRQASGAAQAALSTDRREIWDLGGYQGVDCIRTRDGLVYAAAWNGSSLKKRTSDLVRTDGGNAAVILSVEGELTGFAFDAAGDLWLTVLTPAGGTLCRARHDSWGASVEQVVTQIDGAPLGALSAVEIGADGKVYFAVVGQESAEQGLESALRTELLAHTGTGAVYVYDPAARTVEQVVGGIAGASGLALDELLPAAEKLAETIAKNAPIAVRACKKAINDGMQVDIDRAVAIEEGLFGSCFETADQKEGMGAFLEKRKHEPYQNK